MQTSDTINEQQNITTNQNLTVTPAAQLIVAPLQCPALRSTLEASGSSSELPQKYAPSPFYNSEEGTRSSLTLLNGYLIQRSVRKARGEGRDPDDDIISVATHITDLSNRLDRKTP